MYFLYVNSMKYVATRLEKCTGSSENLCEGCGRNVLARDSLIGPSNQDYFCSVSMRG